MKEIICTVSTITLMTVVLLLAIISVGYLFDSVPIVVRKGNTIIYSGRSACVSCESAGDTTRVGIRGGLLCIFPKEYHVSKDITMEGKK